MKNEDTLLYVGLGLLALLFLRNSGKASASPVNGGTLGVQTNPASRNPATGVGNAPNSKSNVFTDIVNTATNLYNTATGVIAGLGTGSTPGATVGIAANKTPVTGTGNPSFDAQGQIEQAQGVTTEDYARNYYSETDY